MTPRQLGYLSKRHKQAKKRLELLAGVIASTTANYSMSAPKEPCAPSDFMPSRIGKKKPAADLDDNALAAMINASLMSLTAPISRT